MRRILDACNVDGNAAHARLVCIRTRIRGRGIAVFVEMRLRLGRRIDGALRLYTRAADGALRRDTREILCRNARLWRKDDIRRLRLVEDIHRATKSQPFSKLVQCRRRFAALLLYATLFFCLTDVTFDEVCQIPHRFRILDLAFQFFKPAVLFRNSGGRKHAVLGRLIHGTDGYVFSLDRSAYLCACLTRLLRHVDGDVQQRVLLAVGTRGCLNGILRRRTDIRILLRCDLGTLTNRHVCRIRATRNQRSKVHQLRCTRTRIRFLGRRIGSSLQRLR